MPGPKSCRKQATFRWQFRYAPELPGAWLLCDEHSKVMRSVLDEDNWPAIGLPDLLSMGYNTPCQWGTGKGWE